MKKLIKLIDKKAQEITGVKVFDINNKKERESLRLILKSIK